ncbi:hypothetical protein D9611_012238 [Ephemerocybe angulata]|uniref:Uncharacterized protein n=1 Tax=Ephemerocybe angulata TaxID=980116 RepID=A0A8H5C5E9_9AGAR|nr:hypothetical protein D9611_012238 [Tulosesus angulatus]
MAPPQPLRHSLGDDARRHRHVFAASHPFDTMTAITQNLPWFVKDLGVSIVGEGRGVGIVVGGSIMKVPQNLLVINGSSRVRTRPFSALIRARNPLVRDHTRLHRPERLPLQHLRREPLYSPILNKLNSSRLLTTAVAAVGTTYALSVISKDTLPLAQLATLPLSLISKFPQIRRFPTAKEVGDPLVQAGFLLALAVNAVLAAQMYMYWGKHEEKNVELKVLGNGSRPETPVGEGLGPISDSIGKERALGGLSEPIASGVRTPHTRTGTPTGRKD